MNTQHTLAAAAAVLLLGVSTAASADCALVANNLISNCGFEASATDFTGWTVSGTDAPSQLNNFYGVESGADLVTNVAPHGGANQAWVYDPANTLTLSQTFATVSGATYTVSFYAQQSALDGNLVAKNALKASFGTATLVTLTNVATSAYTLYTYDVAAAASSTTFSIGMTDTSGQWLLDDFAVTADAVVAVPETSTPLLMGAGLLALGFAARRKRP
jgi:hypothetical protein